MQEQRFNVGNEKFGHAADQEDGTILMEQSDGNNNRIGQYQYIGDDGKTYTVKYEAGVNGFRILGGDHIPSGGQNAADAVLVDDKGEPKEYDYEYYDETPPASPFVNPYDPSHQQPELLAGNLAGHLAGVYQPPPSTTARPLIPGVPTAPAARRFFPQGSLNFERFGNGFNYKFQSKK